MSQLCLVSLWLLFFASACGGEGEAHSSDARVPDVSSPEVRPSANPDHDAGASEFVMLGFKNREGTAPRLVKREKSSPVTVGAMIRIGSGKVLAGSPPGTPYRNPGAELDEVPILVPSFEIDVLPYPNDPTGQPLTNVTHAKAAELCEEEGKRLCHELEWELACEGSDGVVYPYGDEYEQQFYSTLVSLESSTGVRGMGLLAEWTAGEYGGDDQGVYAVRGVSAEAGKASPSKRRCAHRSKLEPDTTEEGLGFRCCRGVPPRIEYKTPRYEPPFSRLELTHEEFQAMIRSVDELERIHDDPTLFSRDDLFHFRGQAGLTRSITSVGAITWKAIRWIPRLGEEIVVASGRDGNDDFIVALYELPGGRYSHAASYTLVHEKSPIILAYTRNPRHIRWMPCLDCADGGLLHLEDDGLVSITQRW